MAAAAVVAAILTRCALVRRQASRKRSELEKLEREFAPLRALRTELDTRARRHVNAMTWVGFGSLSSMIGLKWYLTYVYFSWDIMEPVTYFSGATVGLIGYWWWLKTNREYEYGSVYDYFLQKRQKKVYARSKLDMAHYKQLEDIIARTQRELETLEFTNYNPALVSAYLERKGLARVA